MRMVLLGPPGAGKGTQAAGLAQRAAVPHIATGDIFRANVAQGTRLGRRAQRYMDRGDLVPDEVVIAMVMDRLAEADCEDGFLLDGFPRTVAQAEALDRRLAGLETPLDAALNFEVTEEELFRRLAGRSAALHRSDDTEQTIRHRLEVFAEKTRPLIDYYRHRGLLVGVDAVASIERVAARIDAALAALGVAAIVASV
jgi:adenylate kinase